MKTSVCIASYNGSKYILDQLKTILDELDVTDEVIIVDDASTDDTINVIKSINDNRVQLYINEINHGHVYSFSRAISLAKNDFIFLSDQDDLWIKGRRDAMLKVLIDSECLLVSSNFKTFEQNPKECKSIKNPLKSKDSKANFRNILGLFAGKRNYFGCAMAFHKDIVNLILPIPSYVEAHDWWIAIAGNILKSNIHFEESTLLHRIHTNNVTKSNRNLSAKIKTRTIFILTIFSLYTRYLFYWNRSS